MPRKTATKYVDTLGQLDAEPLRHTAEYLASKKNNLLFMKPPMVSTVGFDIGSFYIDMKVEREVTQKFLDLLCQERLAHGKVNAARLKQMMADQNQLQDGFIKLNSFIRDLNDKAKVANLKVASEIQKQKALDSNIEAKVKAIDELAMFRNELKKTTKQYELYESVIEAAVKKSKDFQTTKEMINRCDAIMIAQMDISNLDSKLFSEIEGMRKRVLRIIQQAKLIALGLKNELISLEHSYDAVSTEYLRWERLYSETVHATMENELNKERVLNALYTIYRLLCKRSGTLPSHGRRPVEKEMDFIREEVKLLQAIIAEYNRRNNISASVDIKTTPKC